jgi:hypothetical protein
VPNAAEQALWNYEQTGNTSYLQNPMLTWAAENSLLGLVQLGLNDPATATNILRAMALGGILPMAASPGVAADSEIFATESYTLPAGSRTVVANQDPSIAVYADGTDAGPKTPSWVPSTNGDESALPLPAASPGPAIENAISSGAPSVVNAEPTGPPVGPESETLSVSNFPKGYQGGPGAQWIGENLTLHPYAANQAQQLEFDFGNGWPKR